MFNLSHFQILPKSWFPDFPWKSRRGSGVLSDTWGGPYIIMNVIIAILNPVLVFLTPWCIWTTTYAAAYKSSRSLQLAARSIEHRPQDKFSLPPVGSKYDCLHRASIITSSAIRLVISNRRSAPPMQGSIYWGGRGGRFPPNTPTSPPKFLPIIQLNLVRTAAYCENVRTIFMCCFLSPLEYVFFTLMSCFSCHELVETSRNFGGIASDNSHCWVYI